MVIGKFKLIAFGLVAFTISLSAIASVYGQSESFYKGKTIRIIVGFTPGGFYDRWARLSYAAAITASRSLPRPQHQPIA